MPLMGQREYGRHRAELGLSGGTHRAVQKAIAAGRIQVVDGKIDSEVADKAWADNTSEGHVRNLDQVKPSLPAAGPEAPAPSDTAAPRVTLAQASTFEKGWRGKLAQLEYQKQSGELVNAEEVKQRWAQIVLLVRNKILGVPSQIRDKVPEISPEAIRKIEGILRKTLEDLASVDG